MPTLILKGIFLEFSVCVCLSMLSSYGSQVLVCSDLVLLGSAGGSQVRIQ